LLDGRVLLFELATGKLRGELAFPMPLKERVDYRTPPAGALAYSSDGRTVAVGSTDGAVRRFDLRTGRELSPLSGHKGAVVALCWKPDGKILSYGEDNQLITWRLRPDREWQPKLGPLTAGALEGLWDVLQSDDPLDVFGSVQTLAANPAQTTPFLRKRLA